MTSLQSKFKALVTRLAPSGAGFITGAITAAVLYVANHVFHITLLDSNVENALTPAIAFLLASIAHNGSKLETDASNIIGDVQKKVDKIEADDPLAKILLTTIQAQIKAHPEFKGDVLKLVTAELAKAGSASPAVAAVEADVPKVIVAIKSDEPNKENEVPGATNGPELVTTAPAPPPATDPAVANIVEAAKAVAEGAPGFKIEPPK